MYRDSQMLVFMVCIAFAHSIDNCIAQEVTEQYKDGLVVNSSGEITALTADTQPVGISTELTGVAADEAILRFIASNSSADIDLSYRISDNIDINRRWFINGLIFPDQNAGLFSVLGERIPFGGDLDLSSEQIAEINRLQQELIDKIRLSTTTRDPAQTVATFSKFTREHETQVLGVLLPHQKAALSEMIISKLGIPGVLYFRDFALGNGRPADQDHAQKVAREQLEEISKSVESLKRQVYNSLTRPLTSAEKRELERLVGDNLDDWFMKLPLEVLIKQLEFVERGAVPPGKTVREFIDGIRELERR